MSRSKADPILVAAAAVAGSLARGDELCCVYARRVLRTAYGTVVDAAPLADWHVWSLDRRWSPAEAAGAVGIATRVHVPTEPGPTGPEVLELGRWHLCQGWATGTGHTFLFFAAPSGPGIVLDSAGIEFRAPPGPQLRFTTWADQARRYVRGVAVAVLRPAP